MTRLIVRSGFVTMWVWLCSGEGAG